MVARPASPVRSANAGEFSPDASGRVDIKQYYSGGLAYKNVEPVPQSGFRQMGGTWRKYPWRKTLSARAITAPATFAGPHTGTQTVWSGTVAGTVAAVSVPTFGISAGSATFTVEALVGGVWTAIRGPFAVAAAAAETRTAAFAPGAQKAATALRIRATFSVSATVTIGAVTAWFEDTAALAPPRFVPLTTDDGTPLVCFLAPGIADFFTAEDGYVGSVLDFNVTNTMLADMGFYAEAATIGLFHTTLQTQRVLFQSSARKHDLELDLWPYNPVAKADLGGNYPKTPDQWDIFIRWTNGDALAMTITVDGEATPAVFHRDATNAIIGSVAFTNATWALFCAALQAELVLLPSLGAGVTVADVSPGAPDGQRNLRVTFGGALSGSEHQLSASIPNSANYSALSYHIKVGKTDKENLFSASRGWPGIAELVQDRLVYGLIPAVPGAHVLSRVGEYFNLNEAGKDDGAAILNKLRSQTNERVLHIKESKYMLVFTDKGVYFAISRTIARNTPMTFVRASEIGAQPNCRPFDLEGVDYYVAINPKGYNSRADGGKQLVSLVYDEVSTTFNGAPVSLLATHLCEKIIRSARQLPETDLDASKAWLMRADGRLVAAQMIRNQDIAGFCEWIAADGGLVREIGIDGKNRLWLAVERAGVSTIEIYDTAIFLQDAVTVTPDLAGNVAGLPYPDGTPVWADADGYVIGPFTVDGGAIGLGDSYASAIVGRWQAPRYESMPQVHVTPGDDVILRPGRIHTAHINILDTGSIAVGANGSTPQNVPLAEVGDPVDQPTPLKTRLLTVSGEDLPGYMTGTTLVITQTRPGHLRVKDYATGAKL